MKENIMDWKQLFLQRMILGGGGGGGGEYKGIINHPSDFPTLAEVETGWWYMVGMDVTDNDPTKTNTMQSFKAGDEIFWIGSGWAIFGNDNLWLDDNVDLFPALPRGLKINDIKELTLNSGVTVEDVLLKDGKVIESLQKTHLDIYVRTTGNDITGNGSSANPYATLKRAVMDAKKKFDYNIDITINLGAGTYTLDESLFLDFEGNYVCVCTIKAEGTDLTAMSTLESGTFASNSHNIHTDTSKSWAVDSLVGKFVRIKRVNSGSMPTTYNTYLPIIRNGSNWVETAFGTNDDIADYDIVDFLVTVNLNNKSVQMYNKFYKYDWYYIKFQNMRGFGGGSSETLSCYLYVCHTGTLSAGEVMKVYGNGSLHNCFIQATSSNALNASSIRSCAVYANTNNCVQLHKGDSSANTMTRSVIRNYSGTKMTPLMFRDNASIGYKNKFINCFAGARLYGQYVDFSFSAALTTELLFDDTNFFLDVRRLFGKSICASIYPNGSVVFVNEPNIGRVTTDGTTEIGDYFDLLNGINLSCIAPTSKQTILKADIIKEKTLGEGIVFPDKIKPENIRAKVIGFDSLPIGTPIDIYVDPIGGDDLNDGLTPSTPKKTLLACSLIPPIFPISQITVHLGAGTYGAGDMVFSFFGADWDFIGESFTEHFSGTPSSVDTTNRLLTYSGVSWTPDEHKGKLLFIPIFAPVGDPHSVGKACFPIVGNTTDTLQIAADASFIIATVTKIITPDAILQAYPYQGKLSVVQVNGVSIYSQSEAFGCMFNSMSIPNLAFNNKYTQGCSVIGYDTRWREDGGDDDSVFYDVPSSGVLTFTGGNIKNCIVECSSKDGIVYAASNKSLLFIGRCVLDGLMFDLNRGAEVGISISDSLEINNSPYDGVKINEYASFVCHGYLAGSGNSGVGVLLMEHALMKTEGKASITGASGDFMFFGGSVKSWATDVPTVDSSVLSIVK